MTTGPDAATLATIGSVIAAFGAAMLFFRIQRELHMDVQGERIWIPWSDRLLIVATLACLLLVLVPITLSVGLLLPTVATAASSVMVAGYILAILAHYRIILGRRFILWGDRRTGPRSNPEPGELLVIAVTVLVALATAAFVILMGR